MKREEKIEFIRATEKKKKETSSARKGVVDQNTDQKGSKRHPGEKTAGCRWVRRNVHQWPSTIRGKKKVKKAKAMTDGAGGRKGKKGGKATTTKVKEIKQRTKKKLHY